MLRAINRVLIGLHLSFNGFRTTIARSFCKESSLTVPATAM
jgi:hypothetical protein